MNELGMNGVLVMEGDWLMDKREWTGGWMG